MNRARTTFNQYGCDKKQRIRKEEMYKRMYSIENYNIRGIMESFSINEKIVKGIRL